MTQAPIRRLASALAVGIALGSGPAVAQGPLNIVATIGMIGDLAGQVAGGCAQVTTLIGDGSDPHLYQARPSDLRALQAADLILFAGLGLEGQLAAVLDRLGTSGRQVLAVSPAAAPPETLIPADEAGGTEAVDPHLWMDAALWSGILPAIARAVGDLRPDCADDAAAAAAALAGELAALHGWIADSVATIPAAQRQLVTAHDAFAYYARAYGLVETAIQGLSTEAEASIADIVAVAELVIDSAVPAVFVESTINPRTIQALVAEVAARGGTVEIGGALYADAMGSAGTPEGSYIGMLRHNTLTLVTALGGAPAPWPEALEGWAAAWNIRP